MTGSGWIGWIIAMTTAATSAVCVPILLRRHRIRVRWRVLRSDPPATSRRLRWPARLDVVAPRWSSVMLAMALTLAAAAAGGPVAGLVTAVYGATGVALLRRTRARRSLDQARREAVDAVAGLAADLRAGLAVARAVADAAPTLDRARRAGGGAAVVAARTDIAARVAQECGAPLADVLERLDAHLRAVDRARAVASAQAAGVRASAALLAALPVAGLGLGSVLDVDPLPVLLRTPIGAAALLVAVALQLTGLAWTSRIARIAVVA